jgi:hypothetical protein
VEPEVEAQPETVQLVMSEVVKHARPTWVYLSQATGDSGVGVRRKMSLVELLSLENPTP